MISDIKNEIKKSGVYLYKEQLMKTGIYRHYKGHVYRVMFIGKHTETLENMVVYQAINAKNSCEKSLPDQVWVRPEKIFLENVVVDGKNVPRFTYLGK